MTMGQIHGVESSRKGGGGGGGGEVVTGPSLFDLLPEDCISNIISLTTPRDACIVASVSKTFESAANSDSVWAKFLPQDYESLVPPSVYNSSSKKELYFALCDHPLLINDGTTSFWLEKASGKKCNMFCMKREWITWAYSPQYWQWISIPESRFEETAELVNVCWFEIKTTMPTRYLSPGTRYSAYIVFKIKHGGPGWEGVPVELGVSFAGKQSPKRLIYFVGPTDRRRRGRETRDVAMPTNRNDGWMEAELGEFFNEESCDDIQTSIIEIMTSWKSGLIIQGIEFRPA